jgi:uncharacterized membrane protein HdeD (DUF308 family)
MIMNNLKLIIGIIFIAFGILSGGIGVSMLGGAFSIPAFLIIALGIYFIISYLNAKLSDKGIDQKISKLKKEKSSKGSLISMFLGSLILIFGIINLFEGSLIIASLISIIIGAGTMYYSFKKFKKNK